MIHTFGLSRFGLRQALESSQSNKNKQINMNGLDSKSAFFPQMHAGIVIVMAPAWSFVALLHPLRGFA